MKDKKLTIYILIISVLFIGLILVEANKKNPVDWTPTFINTDKNPYGTYIVFDLLKDVFPGKEITVSRLPVYNELRYVDEDEVKIEDYYADESEYVETQLEYEQEDTDKTYHSYLFINQGFGTVPISWEEGVAHTQSVDKLDIKNLLAFVEEGNNAFISAESMSPFLLDTLGLKITVEWASSDTTFIFSKLKSKEYTFTSVRGALHYFEKTDSAKVSLQTLAESKKNHQPVFVEIKHGKGFLYLNTLPVAFSNVELLKPDKYRFAFTCLSYLPKTNNIIWDEYQKQGRIGEYSVFRVIWIHPAMLWGYYIILAGGLLFILFRSKRTQRIIPVIEPPKNTSLEFLDTLSNLYYQKQAYESIVEKRHNYFLDLVRTRYYLRTETIDDEFIKTLSLKSGVEAELVESIFALKKEISEAHDISNGLLLTYNEKLEEFYKTAP
ncbi:DUF4350 domain-containing protein [Viscerimonas tarda]